MRVLVYGANGAQMGPAAEVLLEQGIEVRVLMRNEIQAQSWRDKGAEVALGDMADYGSLVNANMGCDAVFLMVPLVRETMAAGVTFGVNAVKAAKAAGISKIIWNTSAPVPDANSKQAETSVNAQVLRQIKAEGISFLGLVPTEYMENFLDVWLAKSIQKSGVFLHSTPQDFKVQWVASRDFGLVAAAALKGELPNEIIQLGGPQALDGNDLTEIFSRMLGRDLNFEMIPAETYRDQLAVKFGSRIANSVYGLYKAIQDNPQQMQSSFVLDAQAVAERFNIELTSLETWLSQHQAFFETEA